MGDCQSVPSRETPPFRRPITLLARGIFRLRTVFGLLNAGKIELIDASITFYAALWRLREIVNSFWPRTRSGPGFAQC